MVLKSLRSDWFKTAGQKVSGEVHTQFLTLFFSRLLNFFNSVVVVKTLGLEKIGYSAILQSVTHQFGVLNELGLSELAAREKNSLGVYSIVHRYHFFPFHMFYCRGSLGLCIFRFFPSFVTSPPDNCDLGFCDFQECNRPDVLFSGNRPDACLLPDRYCRAFKRCYFLSFVS